MKRLTEIGMKLGTDKAEYHQFTEVYDDYFGKIMQKIEQPRVLEVGILDGSSLKMYDEFFRGKAKIIGVDVAEKSNLFPYSDAILTVRGDILNPDTVDKLRKANAGKLFDIIIDDGGHMMEQQQKTLVNLWPLLKEGGLFIIEDLHTSGYEDYNPDRTTSTLSILKGMGEDNPQFLASAYVSADKLKELYDEMESCVVAEIPFEQVRTQQPRVSITSMIIKKTGLHEVIEQPQPFTAEMSSGRTLPPPPREEAKSMEEIEKEWAARNLADNAKDSEAESDKIEPESEVEYQKSQPAEPNPELSDLARYTSETKSDKMPQKAGNIVKN